VLAVAVVLQTVHQEPVYVQPDRPPPVLDRREPKAVYIVARHRRDVLVGEAEPIVFQGIYQSLRSRLLGDTGEKRRKVRYEKTCMSLSVAKSQSR
jgi:hypothetical protein